MPITVEVIGDGIEVGRAIREAFAWFCQVDEVYSTYKPSSQISQLNAAKLNLSQASIEVHEVLERCEHYRQATEGYFDIRQHGQIDPSGLVKGWSIAVAAQRLAASGMANFAIEAGGDIQANGVNASGKPWNIGIRDPDHPADIIKVVQLAGGACATSGRYERGNHIYNPHTGQAATEVASVTIVGPDIETADVYATAIFAAGTDGLTLLHGLDGYEGYLITPDRQAVFTDGFTTFTN